MQACLDKYKASFFYLWEGEGSDEVSMSHRQVIRNPYQAKRKRKESSGGADSIAGKSAVSKDASALVISASDKAGMEGIDREAIDAIILKESGNSLFMQQQRRRDEKVDARIDLMRKKLQEQEKSHKGDWRLQRQRDIDAQVPTWLASRLQRSTKVVVDMDAYYMSVELLSRPDITADVPACVGGSSMILTSNYAARRFGVRSAMPGYIAEQLVHQLSKGKEKLVFCKSNFDLYKEKSLQIRRVLSEFDPDLTAYSLDEAYLDLGPYLACHLSHPEWEHKQITETILQARSSANIEAANEENELDGREPTASFTHNGCIELLLTFTPTICLSHMDTIVAKMRDRVRIATGGLTCSAGVAPNFLLAKIASDQKKPNGQLIVASDNESVTDFLHPLPIRKVSGIGRVTAKILQAFGIATVRQMYEERALVSVLFQQTSSTSSFLLKASIGCSSSDGKVSEEESSSSQQKGISRERTMQSGKSWAEVNAQLEKIGRMLASDMKRKNLRAHTITVKVKLHTFDCLSRSRTMPRGVYLYSAEDLVNTSTALLQEIRSKELESNSKGKSSGVNDHRRMFSVRLLGIRCSNFQDEESSGQTTIDSFLRRSSKPTSTRHCCSPLMPEKSNEGIRNPYSPQPPTRPVALRGSIRRENDEPETRESHHKERESAQFSMQCPVCDRRFEGDTEEATNDSVSRHVDTCLNGSMVRQAVREKSARASGRRAQREGAKLTDFFPTTESRGS